MSININDFMEVTNYPNFSSIKLMGFIDAGIVSNIKPVLTSKLSSNCNNIIINLEGSEFLDSHGIGFFVSLLKNVHSKKGSLIFAGAHGQPASVLKMVGFNNSLVTYCDTLDEAEKLMQ